MKKIPLLLSALSLLMFAACSAAPAETAAAAAPAPTPAPVTADMLTLEQKVGQLFIVRPDALDLTLSQETINDAHADLSLIHI